MIRSKLTWKEYNPCFVWERRKSWYPLILFKSAFLSFSSFCNAGIDGSNLDDLATKISSSESVTASVTYEYRFL